MLLTCDILMQLLSLIFAIFDQKCIDSSLLVSHFSEPSAMLSFISCNTNIFGIFCKFSSSLCLFCFLMRFINFVTGDGILLKDLVAFLTAFRECTDFLSALIILSDSFDESWEDTINISLLKFLILLSNESL